MGHVTVTDQPDNAWDHFAWYLPAITAALLAVSTVVAVAGWSEDAPVLHVGAGVAAFAGWQIAWRPWRHNLADRCGLSIRDCIVWGLGTIAMWTVLTLTDPVFYLLLFAIFSMLFTATPIRIASGLAVVQAVAIAGVNLQGVSDGGTVAGVLVLATLSGGMAIVMGRWINGIIEQSRERAALIGQLEATRAELADAERTAGAMAERAHWSAEIHDTLAQGFTSVVVLLEAVQASLSSDNGIAASVHDRLELAVHTARTNLSEARNLVGDLAPAALDGTSLPDAVRRAGGEVAAATGATVEVTVEGEPRRLPVDQEVAILRVAQESLANIGRHADAHAIDVAMRYPPDGGLQIAIRDDGTGFDTAGPRDGYGIDGMTSRLRALDGDLRVTSVVGQGTTVEAILS